MADDPIVPASTVMDTALLKQFLEKSKKRLQTALARLQWTAQDVEKICNTNVHKQLEAETQTAPEEPEFPPSYANNNSLVIVPSELQQIVGVEDVQVPKRFSDLQLNFTREQKLSIYEYVVQHTEKCIEPELTVPALGEGKLTFAEIVAKEKKREKTKRRRYRCSKPTLIEEVRGVVELQMQAFQQYTIAKTQDEKLRTTKEKSENDSKDVRKSRHIDRHEDSELRRSRSPKRSRHRCSSRHEISTKTHRDERDKYESSRRRKRDRSNYKSDYQEERSIKRHGHRKEKRESKDRRKCSSENYRSAYNRSPSQEYERHRRRSRSRKHKRHKKHRSKSPYSNSSEKRLSKDYKRSDSKQRINAFKNTYRK